MPQEVSTPNNRLRSYLTLAALFVPVLAISPLFPRSAALDESGARVVVTGDLAASQEPIAVDWRMLGGLNYMTGEISDTLRKLDGKIVKVPGFIVPLEDYMEEAAEFLLVPYFGACVHSPPPPPNQIVYVTMNNKRRVKIGWWDPVWMEGKLVIKEVESAYGMVGFQLEGVRTTPYTE